MAAAMVLAVAACGTLPEHRRPPKSYAIVQETEAISAELREMDKTGCGDQCSGYAVLNLGKEALQWRLALIDSAQKSIDIQYFIWHSDDAVGVLLLDRVIRAADRGVKVRLLLDDSQIADSRKKVAGLNLHPNLEVRGYNPFVSKSIFGISHLYEFIFHLDRLNQRMHNKLMVADNAIAIVGGRNIGNEYFGLNEDTNFRDMDLLAVGPIASDVSDGFDLYWNSKWSYHPEALIDEDAEEKDYRWVREHLAKAIDKNSEILSDVGMAPGKWDALFSHTKERLIFSRGRVVYDYPPTDESDGYRVMAPELEKYFQSVQKEILLVSPYFIPTKNDVDAARKLTDRGVKIRLLTNSLGSNNHTTAHACYEKYRKKMLNAGVDIYELRADAVDKDFYSTDPVRSKWLGLHAKVMIFDRTILYVGTLNMDPRAIVHNTEMGVILESPELASQVESAFERDMLPKNSWHVEIDEQGKLRWKSSAGTRKTQPAKNVWQQCINWLTPVGLIEDQI
jgi:putative cardiolipin synthase